MAQKPENAFIGRVHKALRNKVHAEKQHNPYRSGTADVWYSGDKGDLWIEYKKVNKVAKSQSIRLELTLQQLKWLRERYYEGRNVAVVLGVPNGGVIFRDLEWESRMTSLDIQRRTVSVEEIARFIHEAVGDRHVVLDQTISDLRDSISSI